jgi:hypothetical protein
MARLINLNLKGGLNVITQGNPESKWPHVLKTASSNSAPVIDFDFSKTPQIDSRLTFTRDTTGTVVDFEGLVKTAKVNEVRFQGARRVENLLNASENFAACEVVAAAVSNASAALNTLTTTDGNAYYYRKTAVIYPIGTTVVFRVEVQSGGTLPACAFRVVRTSGSENSYKVINFANAGIYSFSITLLSADTIAFGIDNRSIFGADQTSTGTAIIKRIQMEVVTGQANQNPSEYVSTGVLSAPWQGAGVDGVKYFTTTNGNTVSSNVVTEAAGVPLTNTITLLAEEARTNLLLNSAIPATRNVTVTAQAYTVSMWGTGTCTLSGTGSGTLTGTGATTRVSLTFTPTAGTLTLTFAGTNTNGQLEAGASMSSYIPVVGTAVPRAADVASFTGAGLSWYNTQQGTFAITALGSAFKAPSDFGALSLTYASATKYLLGYDNGVKSGSTYLYTAATVSNPTEYTGVAVPTTIYVNAAGIANISKFTYYPKALKANKMAALL